ncbi:MAG TPA: hypothetical protein DCR65_03020 [Gammaproteobacteria bacterium]|jgi:hypothetical protein|nr:hypothetical protein [Gammaproteobacteria bacterium]
MTYLVRFLLLMLAFALTTAGLVGWHDLEFSLASIWPLGGELALHPTHLLMLGLAMAPPALWEIFALEHNRLAPRPKNGDR